MRFWRKTLFKLRRKGRGGGGERLREAEKTEVGSNTLNRVVFKGRQAAFEIGVGDVLRKIGRVLSHQGKKEGVRPKTRVQSMQNVNGVGAAGGQDQMPNDHSVRHQAVIANHGRTRLAEHFLQGFDGNVKIIGSRGIRF